VFFFDRNGFWVGPGGQNIFPVADSFAVFLESLHDEKAPDVEAGTADDQPRG
jgi:hypothetical protein